jgi:hypothetical protein
MTRHFLNRSQLYHKPLGGGPRHAICDRKKFMQRYTVLVEREVETKILGYVYPFRISATAFSIDG